MAGQGIAHSMSSRCKASAAAPDGLVLIAAEKVNSEMRTMKRFRLRLSSMLWLVVIAAAFLAGTRYGEYRARLRPRHYKAFIARDVYLLPAESAKLKVETEPIIARPKL